MKILELLKNLHNHLSMIYGLQFEFENGNQYYFCGNKYNSMFYKILHSKDLYNCYMNGDKITNFYIIDKNGNKIETKKTYFSFFSSNKPENNQFKNNLNHFLYFSLFFGIKFGYDQDKKEDLYNGYGEFSIYSDILVNLGLDYYNFYGVLLNKVKYVEKYKNLLDEGDENYLFSLEECGITKNSLLFYLISNGQIEFVKENIGKINKFFKNDVNKNYNQIYFSGLFINLLKDKNVFISNLMKIKKEERWNYIEFLINKDGLIDSSIYFAENLDLLRALKLNAKSLFNYINIFFKNQDKMVNFKISKYQLSVTETSYNLNIASKKEIIEVSNKIKKIREEILNSFNVNLDIEQLTASISDGSVKISSNFILNSDYISGISVEGLEYKKKFLYELVCYLIESKKEKFNFDLFSKILKKYEKKIGIHDTYFPLLDLKSTIFVFENENNFSIEKVTKYKNLINFFEKRYNKNYIELCNLSLNELSELYETHINKEKQECIEFICKKFSNYSNEKISKIVEGGIMHFVSKNKSMLEFFEFIENGKFDFNMFDFLHNKCNKNLYNDISYSKYYYKINSNTQLGIKNTIKYLLGEKSKGINGFGNKPGLLFKKIKNHGKIKNENEYIPYIIEHGNKNNIIKYEIKIEKSTNWGFIFAGDYSKCCMNYGSNKMFDYLNEKGYSIINFYENGKVVGNSLIHLAYYNGKKTLILDNIEINPNRINKYLLKTIKYGILKIFDELKNKYQLKQIILGNGNDLIVKNGIESNNKKFLSIGTYKKKNQEKNELYEMFGGKNEKGGFDLFKRKFYSDIGIKNTLLQTNGKFLFKKRSKKINFQLV